MTDYAELRAALESATPGPWTQGESAAGRSCVWVGGKSEPDRDMGPDCSWIDCNTEPNARYIAACRPEAIRALLAERDALAEAVDCLHAFAGRVAPSASFWDDTWPKLDAAIARAALAQGEA